MKNRYFLKLAVAGSSALFAASCSTNNMSAASNAVDNSIRPSEVKPNVVIFYLDDSGYGDYSHNGNPTVSTPNITKLTQSGVNFSQFYVASSVCSASRYSLLTGRYPSRSGLEKWVISPSAKRYLHKKEITIADGLKANGYTTAMFGKWHLGTPNKSNGFSADALPLAHGFDQWLGTNVSHDYNDAMLIKSDPKGKTPVPGYRVLFDKLPSHPKVGESLTGRYTDAAIKFIEKNRDKPFFAYIAYNMPHLSLYVSDKFKGVSRRGKFGDTMAEIDDSIGRIRKAIDDVGLAKNTIIFFSSDNGPWIKFKQDKLKNNPKYGDSRLDVGYAWPFRDGKGGTWEGGYRVPGVFCWPGKIRANVVEQTPASTLDVLPTIFKLTGTPIPKDRDIDGRDISSLLIPSKSSAKLPAFTFFYHHIDNIPTAVRVGPWKMYIKTSSQTGNNYGFTASWDKPLLFQLEHDCEERIDRASEHPDLVRSMKQKLKTFIDKVKKSGSYWDK